MSDTTIQRLPVEMQATGSDKGTDDPVGCDPNATGHAVEIARAFIDTPATVPDTDPPASGPMPMRPPRSAPDE